ncbi:antitermination protein [Roseibium polysiphoniae]|uniref:antitermination protein n=1 Tax=Roseibium polysiphoniae TaxID=2571221 RepID=UPI0032990FF7
MKTIAVATLCCAFTALIFNSFDDPQDAKLTRVDCVEIAVFAPSNGKAAEDLCRNYGGVAEKDAQPSDEGLVILVRNQPMGGFSGQNSVR